MAESLTKEFHKLMKDIKRMSDGQAKLFDWNDEDVSSFKVEIAPNGGPYHGGKFIFKVDLGDNFPEKPPAEVHCETKIYHPNINSRAGTSGTNVCLNLFSADEWLQLTKPGIENVIQGLLFLFYEPNIDDPLSPLFHPTPSWELFLKNVKLSLLGLTVLGERYPWNFGNGTPKDTIKAIVGIGLTTGVPGVFKREGSKMFDGNRTISFNAFHEDMPRTDSVFFFNASKGAEMAPATDSELTFTGSASKGAELASAPDSELTFTGSASKGAEVASALDSVFTFTGSASKGAEVASAPDSLFTFTGSASKGAEMAPAVDSLFTFTGSASKGAEMAPAVDSLFTFTGSASKGAEMAPAPDSLFTFTGSASMGAEMAPALDSIHIFSGSASIGAEMTQAPMRGAKASRQGPLTSSLRKSGLKFARKRKSVCF